MAILLDLANELLLPILDYLPPIEMVNLAMSCKRINTLAEDNLILHQQRIRKYQDVTLWGCFRHQDQAHPILLLRDICNDWRVAYYARSLAIECCGRDPTDPDALRENIFVQGALVAKDAETVKRVLPEITIPVRKMLSMAFRWDETEIDNIFHKMQDGARGARGAILGLLLISLPAIRSISFKRYVWGDDLWIDSMRRITNQQDYWFRAPKATFLMDVSELNLEDGLEGHLAGTFCSLMPFVSLPSLRVIRGASIESRNFFDDSQFCENHGLPHSPVTEIDLQRTNLPACTLEHIVRYSHVLKRFRYDRRAQSDLFAEPGGTIKMLLQYASHSLESLVLTGASSDRSPYDKHIEESLCNFKVLKELHIPAHTLLTYMLHYKCLSFPTEDIPRLVDVLPASIERVRLDGEMTWKEIAPLLLGLPEGKAEYLPKLKEIQFTVGRDQGEAHKQTQALAPMDQERGMVIQLDEDEAAGNDGHYSVRFVFL